MATVALLNQQPLLDTGLFQEWSYKTFNKIKDIDVSHRISLDGIVQRIGSHLCDIGLNDLIGISRTHNHFKLNSDEVVQLSFGTSIEDPTVKVDHGAMVAHLNVIKLTSTDPLPIAYMWAYDKCLKQFFPMQFVDSSNTIIKQRFEQLCGEKRNKLIAFICYFIREVEQNGVEDDLGFYIRYEDLMKVDRKNGEILVEDTDIDSRRQWMLPNTKEMLQTMLNDKQKIH
ncbi:unnamed protein product, partial [Adineta steineri]